jgi:hypothetical protein
MSICPADLPERTTTDNARQLSRGHHGHHGHAATVVMCSTYHGFQSFSCPIYEIYDTPIRARYALLTGGLPTDAARGFPVCRATVAYPAQGYAAVFGWTQLVCSTDSDPDQFELDPIALYSEVATPYAWFGVKPELFDAPESSGRLPT